MSSHTAPAPLSGFYGLWRRIAPRSALDASERRKRDHEEAWDLRHEEHADRLDALKGRTGQLRVALEAFNGETYDAGEQFIVRGRVKDKLICESLEREDEPVTLTLKEEWLRW